VLCAVGWEPTPVEVVLRRCALARAEVTLQLAHLELDGLVTNGPAGWQRAGPVLS
jgi:predicted Rossmann fold nucleotide-binding protein DprA/Smf involved in DNA uptake